MNSTTTTTTTSSSSSQQGRMNFTLDAVNQGNEDIRLWVGCKPIELEEKQQDAVNKAFKDIEMTFKGSNHTFSLKTMCITYLDKDNNNEKKVVNLLEDDRYRSILSPLLPALEEMQKEIENQGIKVDLPDFSEPRLLIGRKTLDAHAPAMIRSGDLPNDFAGCAKLAMEIYSSTLGNDPATTKATKEEAALKRIVAVEHMIHEQQKAQKEQNWTDAKTAKESAKQAKQADLIKAQQDKEPKQIIEGLAKEYKEIADEVAQLDKFSDCNRFALYVAAVFAPEKPQNAVIHDPEAVLKAVMDARLALDNYFANNGWTSSIMGLKAPDVDSAQYHALGLRGAAEKYSLDKNVLEHNIDVAALIFSVLPKDQYGLAREEVRAYYKHLDCTPKAHCLEDDIIRALYAPEDPNPRLANPKPEIEAMRNALGIIDPTTDLAKKCTKAFKDSRDFRNGATNTIPTVDEWYKRKTISNKVDALKVKHSFN